MKTINLAYPERGDIKFKVLSFPDGQQDIVIENPEDVEEDVRIVSRLSGFKDLELIICAAAALEEIGGIETKVLRIPYLLGARSDRKFVPGGTHYLRDVIAPIINDMEFNLVEIMDAHSDVTEAVIDNYEPYNENVIPRWIDHRMDNDYILVCPDGGALKKIYKAAAVMDYDGPIIICQKHREISTGKILSTTVPLNGAYDGKDFLILDDIADGARTFIEIAKKIREDFRAAKIFLGVTHGIFSQGLAPLREHFAHIYTTNSVRDLDVSDPKGVADFITQYDVLT
jgi:ribose-phosphate pyrophosphokinase